MKKTSVSRFERDAGIFSESTNVYAPFFRQASVYALQNKSEEEADQLLKSGPVEDVFVFLSAKMNCCIINAGSKYIYRAEHGLRIFCGGLL